MGIKMKSQFSIKFRPTIKKIKKSFFFIIDVKITLQWNAGTAR